MRRMDGANVAMSETRNSRLNKISEEQGLPANSPKGFLSNLSAQELNKNEKPFHKNEA